MELPKLYRPVAIRFWSLRMGVGASLGVMEYDEKIDRKAMRVLTKDGWKWQIKNISRDYLWDWPILQDQEVLNDIGEDMSDIEIMRR